MRKKTKGQVPKYTGYDMKNSSSARSPDLADGGPSNKMSKAKALKSRSRTDGAYQHACDTGKKMEYAHYNKTGT